MAGSQALALEQFWANVDKNGPVPVQRPELGPCWLWKAGRTNGYGVCSVDGRHIRAHRFAYEALVGPIPPGKELDHLCRNRPCVNPDHVEPVTTAVNVLRGVGPTARAARATHCPQGHPYDEQNTRVRPDGSRACRRCGAARALRAYHGHLQAGVCPRCGGPRNVPGKRTCADCLAQEMYAKRERRAVAAGERG